MKPKTIGLLVGAFTFLLVFYSVIGWARIMEARTHTDTREARLEKIEHRLDKLEDKQFVLGTWAIEHTSDLMHRIEEREAPE